MSYEHRSNVNIKRTPFPLKTVLGLILILGIIYFVSPSFLPSIFTKIAAPFWGLKEESTIKTSVDLENALITELQRENIELKAMLGRTGTSTPILAYIVKKPPFTAYDSFIIDAGTNNGVDTGDKVYAKGDVLLGEIVEVLGMSSKVKLYSTDGEKYNVFIADKDGAYNIQAPAVGKGGGAFEATLPRDVKIKEGDIVTIPNLKVSIFGIVNKVIADPARTFSTILFSQPVNIYEQKWVFIYKNNI